MHDGARAFRFTLSGILDAAAAVELERAWRTAWRIIGKRTFIVDLTYLTGCDSQGGNLLRYWRSTGARFVCESARSRELAESITGIPPAAAAESRKLQTWVPFVAGSIW